MESLRLAVVQTNWPGDRETMLAAYRQLVAEAARNQADLVCLQEFTISPYFASVVDADNFKWAEPLHGGPTDQFLSALAKEHGVWLIGSIFEALEDNDYRDTATLYNPAGEMVGITRKVHIPQGDGYHEDHYFEGDVHYPVHSIGALKLSVPTCYDQWFPEVSRISALNGAEFIFYPTAIGSEPTAPLIDTKDSWQTVMRGQAIANGVYIAAANRVGVEGVAFYGSSFICDPMGNIIAEASRDQSEVIYADLDPDLFNEWRRLFPLLKQRRPNTYQSIAE